MGVTEYNQKIIEEFRANKGVVGGPFAGANLLLLHSIGAKSGEKRVNPLAYFEYGDTIYIVASYAGSDNNPPWFHNLKTNPYVSIEVGEKTCDAIASELDEPERTEIYTKIANQSDAFAAYQKKTSRVIPIFALRES